MRFVRWVARQWARLFPPKKAVPKRRAERRDREHYGAHYYLGDLLDQIDRTFLDFKAVKKSDREAYDMFSKVGASVMNSDSLIATDVQPMWSVTDPPSMGCFHSGGYQFTYNDEPPRFVYFMKVKRPINVAASNVAVYKVGLVYDDEKLGPALGQFYVALSPNGGIYPLKQCKPTRYKTGDRGGFWRMEWHWPKPLEIAAEERGQTTEQRAAEIFTIAANAAMTHETGLTVRVRKGKDVVAFAIDMERTPYFFSDRDKTVTEDGATKKIFHIVRGHWRTMAGGEKKFIKPHFRGLRKFTWNGYDVTIRLSGKHGVGLMDATFAAMDPADDRPGLTSEEVGERMDEALSA